MQKSKIPTLSFNKPALTSTSTHGDKRKTTQVRNDIKPSLVENKFVKSKATAEKCATDSSLHRKDNNKNTSTKSETVKKNNITSIRKVEKKIGPTKAEASQAKSVKDSCKIQHDIKNRNQNITKNQNKCVSDKMLPSKTSQRAGKKAGEIEQNTENDAAKNITHHPSQPNIQFVADERFRNMILSGKELSPGILKHTSMKTSFYDRPPSLYRNSYYQPPSDPHKAALKALENMHSEGRRSSALKKTNAPSWISPFKDPCTPLRVHTPCDVHRETIRKLYKLQLKQEKKSVKKVTFKLPDSDSKPSLNEKENIQFRLSVISDKSETSDQSTPELNGIVSSVPNEIPLSASPKSPVPESRKIQQDGKVPTCKGKDVNEQYETCSRKNDSALKICQIDNLPSEADEKNPLIPCKPSEARNIKDLDKRSDRSQSCFGTNDSNSRPFNQQKPISSSEMCDISYSNNHPFKTGHRNVQCEQKSVFQPDGEALVFSKLRTSISSPELFRSYFSVNENLLRAKIMDSFSGSNCSISGLRSSISSPELRNMPCKDFNETNGIFHKSLKHHKIQARLYSPYPVALNQQFKHVDNISHHELLTKKTANYIAHVPILTPLVMKNLAETDDQCDLSPVRQKLEFEDEPKEHEDSKELDTNVFLKKIVTVQKIMDHLADQECCIILSNTAFPDFYNRHISNPIAKVLENGDEMHFVPVDTVEL